MIRLLGGFGFLALALGCFAVAAHSIVAPPQLPVYTARGLTDLANHGEPIPDAVILITAGFTDEPQPAYYPTYPGPPAIVFTSPPPPNPLPRRVVVRCEGSKPIRVTVLPYR